MNNKPITALYYLSIFTLTKYKHCLNFAMVKRNKSNEQIKLLRYYYRQKPYNWTKLDLIQITKKTGLKRNQVYKWLWDQRNRANQSIQLQQQQIIQLNNNNKPTRSFQHSKKIVLVSEKLNVKVSLPQHVQTPQYIKLSTQTSDWAKRILIYKGWQLIRQQNIVQKRQLKKNKVEMFEIMDEKVSFRQDKKNQE